MKPPFLSLRNYEFVRETGFPLSFNKIEISGRETTSLVNDYKYYIQS